MLELKAIRLQQKIGQERSERMFTFSNAKKEYWETVKQMVEDHKDMSVGQYIFSVKTPKDEWLGTENITEFIVSDQEDSILDYWTAYEDFREDGSIFTIYIDVLLNLMFNIKRKIIDPITTVKIFEKKELQEFEQIFFDDMIEFFSTNRHHLSKLQLKYFLEDIF